ncbi:unnamed protein product, partial [Laminaria digitata]
ERWSPYAPELGGKRLQTRRLQLFRWEQHGKNRSRGDKEQKRQVVPSLAEVASSVELLGRLTLPDDRVHPVSSNLARARASELATAEAAADAAHAAKTDRANNIIQLKDRPRIASLPFPSSVDP